MVINIQKMTSAEFSRAYGTDRPWGGGGGGYPRTLVEIDENAHSLLNSSENNDNLEFKPSCTASVNDYVVPKFPPYNIISLYPDDYILNIFNYGIIFNNGIHWYEIGTNKLVLITEINEELYDKMTPHHRTLIFLLAKNNIDLISLEKFRDIPSNFSKEAARVEQAKFEEDWKRETAKFEQELKEVEQKLKFIKEINVGDTISAKQRDDMKKDFDNLEEPMDNA